MARRAKTAHIAATSDKYSEVQTLTTMSRANTLALDPKTNKIYLSAARFEEETTPDSKRRQSLLPGSFMISVYRK